MSRGCTRQDGAVNIGINPAWYEIAELAGADHDSAVRLAGEVLGEFGNRAISHSTTLEMMAVLMDRGRAVAAAPGNEYHVEVERNNAAGGSSGSEWDQGDADWILATVGVMRPGDRAVLTVECRR